MSEQREAINSFHARAGLLLSAAAVTTSFLGSQAMQGRGSSFFSWMALLSFIAVAATSLAILWPRKWELTASPRDVIESRIESSDVLKIEDLYRDLSLRMHGSWLVNHRGLEHLAAAFQAASGLLTIEVVLWIAAIASDL